MSDLEAIQFVCYSNSVEYCAWKQRYVIIYKIRPFKDRLAINEPDFFREDPPDEQERGSEEAPNKFGVPCMTCEPCHGCHRMPEQVVLCCLYEPAAGQTVVAESKTDRIEMKSSPQLSNNHK